MQVNRLVFLDLATRIGFAYGSPLGKPSYGAHLLPSTGAEIGRFIDEFDSWLSAQRWFLHGSLIVYEAPILPRLTTQQTVRKLNGLAAYLEFKCYRSAIHCRQADLQSIKKFWTGNGRAKKPEMCATARARGYVEIGDNNGDEADALAGWWFVVNSIDERLWAAFRRGAAA